MARYGTALRRGRTRSSAAVAVPAQWPARRAGRALEEAAPWRAEYVRRIYAANFADDRDIGDRAVVGDVLGSLGLPVAEILESAQSRENKERLRLQTEEAVRLGIFGAPSFVVGAELFWGNDRLEQAVAWCKEP